MRVSQRLEVAVFLPGEARGSLEPAARVHGHGKEGYPSTFARLSRTPRLYPVLKCAPDRAVRHSICLKRSLSLDMQQYKKGFA